MERLRGSKPSPAMVVSIIALVFALAGSAAAGVATISVLSKKEKKQTRNIAKDEINKAAPGLSVASAANADNATNAQTATNATTAESATNATHADNADQADNSTMVNSVGVEGVLYRQNGTTNSPQTLVNLGGLTLTANCNAGILSLIANTSVDNATLSSAAVDTGSDEVSVPNTNHIDDFDTTVAQGLLGSPHDDLVLNIQYTRPAGGILTPPAATSAVLMVDNDGAPTCLVTGHAFQSGGTLTP
jgi:hypothetical protein